MANTSKPVVAWANSPEAFLDIYQMAVSVAGGEDILRAKPAFAYFTTYELPLKLANEPLANLMLAAVARHSIHLPGRTNGWVGIAVHRRFCINAVSGECLVRFDYCSIACSRGAHGDWRAALDDGLAHGPPSLWLSGSQPAHCRIS